MRRSEFNKHINLLNEEELKQELITLFSKLNAVKQYYIMELGGDEERKIIYKKAKENIASKYATKSYRKPKRPRIQKVNTIINRLKNDAVFPFEMIDIYLFNAETAIQFQREYAYDSKPLYNTIISSYSKALDLISSEKMHNVYEDRCTSVLRISYSLPWVYIKLLNINKKVYNK